MTASDIATLIMSTSALISSLILVWKARGEKSKVGADTEKSHVETYALLSEQLKEAYVEIDKLRANQEKIICHRDYEAHLLRCITRLSAQLSSREITPQCEPMSFDEFMKQRDNGNEKTEPIK